MPFKKEEAKKERTRWITRMMWKARGKRCQKLKLIKKEEKLDSKRHPFSEAHTISNIFFDILSVFVFFSVFLMRFVLLFAEPLTCIHEELRRTAKIMLKKNLDCIFHTLSTVVRVQQDQEK